MNRRRPTTARGGRRLTRTDGGSDHRRSSSTSAPATAAPCSTARRGHPTFVLGLDAMPPRLAAASRRAARLPGGVVRPTSPSSSAGGAAAGRARGLADLVTVLLPWGSLLRGVLGRDDAVAAGLATLLGPTGTLEAIFTMSATDAAVTGSDAGAGPDVEAIRATFGRAGLEVASVRPATPDELLASGSTWAKRLGLRGTGNATPDRRAWRLTARRSPGHVRLRDVRLTRPAGP